MVDQYLLIFTYKSTDIGRPSCKYLQHGLPSPYLAINGPNLYLSLAIAMVDQAVYTYTA
jgi:hypothetical protein